MMYSLVCGSFHEVLRQHDKLDTLEYFRQQQDLLGKAYRIGAFSISLFETRPR
jgi:hypothetical protein